MTRVGSDRSKLIFLNVRSPPSTGYRIRVLSDEVMGLGSHGRNLEARTEAESKKEPSLLVCFPCPAQLPFLHSPGPPA